MTRQLIERSITQVPALATFSPRLGGKSDGHFISTRPRGLGALFDRRASYKERGCLAIVRMGLVPVIGMGYVNEFERRVMFAFRGDMLFIK